MTERGSTPSFETNEQRYLRLVWTFDPSFRESIRTLTRNLAVAGALCRAFILGREHLKERIMTGRFTWREAYVVGSNPWRPGCGRSAP